MWTPRVKDQIEAKGVCIIDCSISNQLGVDVDLPLGHDTGGGGDDLHGQVVFILVLDVSTPSTDRLWRFV